MPRTIRVGRGGYTLNYSSEYLMTLGILLLVFAAAPIAVNVRGQGADKTTELTWPHQAFKGTTVLGLGEERDVLAARGLLALAGLTAVLGILTSLATRSVTTKYLLGFLLGGAAMVAVAVLHPKLHLLSPHFASAMIPNLIGLGGLVLAAIGAGVRMRRANSPVAMILAVAGAAGLALFFIRPEDGLPGVATSQTPFDRMTGYVKEGDWLSFLPMAALAGATVCSLLSIVPGRGGRLFSGLVIFCAVAYSLALPGTQVYDQVKAKTAIKSVEIVGWYGRVIGLAWVFCIGSVGLITRLFRRLRRIVVGREALSFDNFKSSLESLYVQAKKGQIGSERLSTEKRALFARIEKYGTLEPKEEFYRYSKALVKDGLLKETQYDYLRKVLKGR